MTLPEEKEYRVTIRIEQLEAEQFQPHAVAVFQSGRSFKTQVITLEDAVFPSREAAVDYAMEQTRDIFGKLNFRADIQFHVKDED